MAKKATPQIWNNMGTMGLLVVMFDTFLALLRGYVFSFFLGSNPRYGRWNLWNLGLLFGGPDGGGFGGRDGKPRERVDLCFG